MVLFASFHVETQEAGGRRPAARPLYRTEQATMTLNRVTGGGGVKVGYKAACRGTASVRRLQTA